MVRRSAPVPAVPPLDLASQRQKAGVSLDQIADSYKISKRFLLAIESGDYDELPGGIFTVSYLKQYAEATGFDPKLLLEHYAQCQTQSAEPKPALRESGWKSLARLLQLG